MMEIEFRYSIDNKVEDRTGRIGFVTDLSRSKSGIDLYYIESKEGGRWQEGYQIKPFISVNEVNKPRPINVIFKYNLGLFVQTTSLLSGIIEQVSFSKLNKYYINGKENSGWFDEEDIFIASNID